MTRPKIRPSLIVGVLSSVLLLGYEWWFRTFREEYLSSSNQVKTIPYLFQNYASDDLLQTVKIADLVSFGPLGLWYFHVQPPLHQALLYILALPEVFSKNPITSEIVDLRLYVVYGLIYGFLNALVFTWLRDLTGSWAITWTFTVLWALYPGNIAMATLLDGTYLSLYLITLMLYLAYRFLKTRQSSYITWWLVALAVTSYTRTIFQIHFVAVIVVALVCFWWIQQDRRRIARMAIDVIIVLIIVALPVQRYLMWGSFSTTTFGGFHRTGMLFYDPKPEAYEAIPIPERIQRNAEVFQSDNNIPLIVADNIRREQLANAWIAEHSFHELMTVLIKSVALNFDTAKAPTSLYSKNEFSHGLPWRAPMNAALSGDFYVTIAVIAILGVFIMAGPRGTIRYFRRYGWLMVFYAIIAGTILLQNRNDWSEAHRLKIFVEIPVWLCAALLTTRIVSRISSRQSSLPSPVTSLSLGSTRPKLDDDRAGKS